MATVRRPVGGTPQPMQRPTPGPTYPWGPGGTSQTPGVPDNWRQFYPNEQQGRGDAWLSVKFGPGGRLSPEALGPVNFNNPTAGMTHQQLMDWRRNQPGTFGKTTPEAEVHPYHDQLAPDHDPNVTALRMHGVQPGPLNQIVGAPGSGGYYTGKKIIPPQQGPNAPGSVAAWQKLNAAAQKQQAGAAPPDYAKMRAGMKPGQTIKQGGKSYFLNQNGALVDVTDPKARKRLTDVKGNVLGAQQTPAAPPPAATAGGSATPPTQPPTAQNQTLVPPAQTQQNDIGRMDYSPMPAQVQDALSQLQNQFSMPRPQFGNSLSYDFNPMIGGGFGGMGGYGMGPPQQFMGYGDPYSQMLGGGFSNGGLYGAGMGGYGDVTGGMGLVGGGWMGGGYGGYAPTGMSGAGDLGFGGPWRGDASLNQGFGGLSPGSYDPNVPLMQGAYGTSYAGRGIAY